MSTTFLGGQRDDELAALAARSNVRLEAADLADPVSWKELGGGYDDVYHCAALLGVKHVVARPHEVVRINALSTIYLLDWFVGGGGTKLLFCSTSEAYAWTRLSHRSFPCLPPRMSRSR